MVRQKMLRSTSFGGLITLILLVSVLTASGFSLAFNNQPRFRCQTESLKNSNFNGGRTLSFKVFADHSTQLINIGTVRISLALHRHDQVIDTKLTLAIIDKLRFLNPIFLTSHKARSSSELSIS